RLSTDAAPAATREIIGGNFPPADVRRSRRRDDASVRLRPVAIRRASRSSQGVRGIAVAAARAALQARGRGADLCRAPGGVGDAGAAFNEHHTSPYGLMTSPNLLAASAAQRTQRLKLLVYGNLLPLHDPLRLAEELAMLDCLSNGRIVSGFARGIPREYNVYN